LHVYLALVHHSTANSANIDADNNSRTHVLRHRGLCIKIKKVILVSSSSPESRCADK